MASEFQCGWGRVRSRYIGSAGTWIESRVTVNYTKLSPRVVVDGAARWKRLVFDVDWEATRNALRLLDLVTRI